MAGSGNSCCKSGGGFCKPAITSRNPGDPMAKTVVRALVATLAVVMSVIRTRFRIPVPLSFSAFAFAFVFAVAGSHANAEPGSAATMKAAIEAAYAENWRDAGRLAQDFGDPVAVDLIAWWRLRAGVGDWSAYLEFLGRNGDWPGLKRLRRKGEAHIPEGAEPRLVLGYFDVEPPQTAPGALRLAQAMRSLGRVDDAEVEVRRAWTLLDMDAATQDAYLFHFGDSLRGLHAERLDQMLWEGWIQSAERMLTLVSSDQARLAKARIALQRKRPGVDAMIRAVPAPLRDDPGLAFDRFVWRMTSGFDKSAKELILSRSLSARSLGRPEAWANRRLAMASDEMEAGRYATAYELVSRHHVEDPSKAAQHEWLAGYVALRMLNRPEWAVDHFIRFRDSVRSPISLGRAHYWLGRTREALGESERARSHYQAGAGYQTSFYGQLAAERIGAAPDPSLTGREREFDWKSATFVDSGSIRAGRLFLIADWEPHARWFFAHVAESLDRDDLIRLGDMAFDLGSPFVMLGVAKEAAKSGLVLPRSYYPVTELAQHSGPVPPEMALSIARTESEFRLDAISRADARGLMQVRTNTAREIAERHGEAFSKRRLIRDWEFNARMGTAYLEELLAEFGGSHVLTFAAYNAGPERVRNWIKRFGHPHLDWADPIDWIEHIPYRETRNYVMRIQESLHVYRSRLSGRGSALRISDDLTRWTAGVTDGTGDSAAVITRVD